MLTSQETSRSSAKGCWKNPTLHSTPDDYGCIERRTQVEAVIDIAATAPVIGWKLGKQLELARRRLPITITEVDGTNLSRGSHIVNSSFRFLGQDFVLVALLPASTLAHSLQSTE